MTEESIGVVVAGPGRSVRALACVLSAAPELRVRRVIDTHLAPCTVAKTSTSRRLRSELDDVSVQAVVVMAQAEGVELARVALEEGCHVLLVRANSFATSDVQRLSRVADDVDLVFSVERAPASRSGVVPTPHMVRRFARLIERHDRNRCSRDATHVSF